MSSSAISDFNENEYAEVKNLYLAISGDRSWESRWSEYKDPAEENQRLQPYRASFPIIHKWTCVEEVRDHWDPEPVQKKPVWVTDSVEINDKALRAKVEEVLADVPGLYFDVDVLAFKPPFAPFLHKWSAFKAALNSQDQDTKLQHLLQHLDDIIDPIISPTLEDIKKACDSQTIDWDLFMSSCVPGELVYGSWLSEPQAYKILHTEWCRSRGSEKLRLHVQYYDWDGQKSGFRTKDLYVERFKGEVPLAELAHIPFQFLKRRASVREALRARGKKFEAMVGYHFKHYKGTKLTKMGGGSMRKGQLNARIIVDAFAYHKFYEESWIDEAFSVAELSDDGITREAIVVIEEDDYQGENGRNAVIKPFTEEQHLLSISTVKAFDLENREWCQVFLDGFSDIEFNDNAYDKLVLKESEKEMILAFSEQVRDRKGIGFDDFIKNKGRGILILLCGSPGVGKTLTAESVAERAHLPLYAVNAGEIGHSADVADNSLRIILECCRLWNAVLLLDEADVFLEARGTDSLTRNELVSVFLRRLEYFGGLSFLTTNRPRSIDPAFESRLDLIIPYPDLDKSARRAIWTTFISQLGASCGHEITETDYDKLADHKCNGREIKNIVKISSMLAYREQTKLKISHVATVLRLRIKAAKTVKGGHFE